MDIVIVICLVLIIALLVSDKVIVQKVVKDQRPPTRGEKALPDIVGKPKKLERHSATIDTRKSQLGLLHKRQDNFESEIKGKISGGVAPQEEPDEVEDEGVDLSEEEGEWYEGGLPNGDDGFATGVTFEELSTVGKVLQQNSDDPDLEKKAAEVVLKIQGTELFVLLESSMADASQKIARLLDKQVVQKMDSGSSNLRSDLDVFDIEEYI